MQCICKISSTTPYRCPNNTLPHSDYCEEHAKKEKPCEPFVHVSKIGEKLKPSTEIRKKMAIVMKHEQRKERQKRQQIEKQSRQQTEVHPKIGPIMRRKQQSEKTCSKIWNRTRTAY